MSSKPTIFILSSCFFVLVTLMLRCLIAFDGCRSSMNYFHYKRKILYLCVFFSGRKPPSPSQFYQKSLRRLPNVFAVRIGLHTQP